MNKGGQSVDPGRRPTAPAHHRNGRAQPLTRSSTVASGSAALPSVAAMGNFPAVAPRVQVSHRLSRGLFFFT